MQLDTAAVYFRMMENQKQSSWVLVLIGCGKLLKAVLLVIIAVQAHKMLHGNMGPTLERWVRHIRVDPENHYVNRLIHRLTGVDHKRLKEISIGSFIYATLFATEGVGLVLRKRWAEYLTVITTSLLLPLEIYEIWVGHHIIPKIVVFILNVAIVVYLILRLKKGSAANEGRVPSANYAE